MGNETNFKKRIDNHFSASRFFVRKFYFRFYRTEIYRRIIVFLLANLFAVYGIR